MNTTAYYKLTGRRSCIEDLIEPYDTAIKDLKEDAKKLKKGSQERQDLMKKANDLNNDTVYKNLKLELRTLNFCINTVFYS